MELLHINKRFQAYLNILNRYTAATAIALSISVIVGAVDETLGITTAILLWLFFFIVTWEVIHHLLTKIAHRRSDTMEIL